MECKVTIVVYENDEHGKGKSIYVEMNLTCKCK